MCVVCIYMYLCLSNFLPSYLERKMYFKELVSAIIGVSSLKSAGKSAGWRPGKELILHLKSKDCLEAEFLCQRTSVLSLKTFS